MSTLKLACILAGGGIAMSLLFLYIVNKLKIKKMSLLLKRFSKLGTFYDLSFSSQELLTNSIIGLDGISRKLLVLAQLNQTHFEHTIIDLDEVKICTLKKYYGNIQPGDLVNRKLDLYLEQVALRFEFYNQKPIEIVFYTSQSSKSHRVKQLEQKAGQWQQMLTKMLKGPVKALAND